MDNCEIIEITNDKIKYRCLITGKFLEVLI